MSSSGNQGLISGLLPAESPVPSTGPGALEMPTHHLWNPQVDVCAPAMQLQGAHAGRRWDLGARHSQVAEPKAVATRGVGWTHVHTHLNRVLCARVSDRRAPAAARPALGHLRPCPWPLPAPAVSRGATRCTGAGGPFPGGPGRGAGAGAGPRPGRAAGSGALFAGRGRAGSSRPRTDIKGESSARGAADRPRPGRLGSAAPRSADPGIRSARPAGEGGTRPALRPARPGFESWLAAARAACPPVKIKQASGSPLSESPSRPPPPAPHSSLLVPLKPHCVPPSVPEEESTQ